MKTLVLTSFWLAFLVSSIPAADSNNWISAQSPNFLIHSDALPADVKRVGSRFELFRQTFDQLLVKTNARRHERITIILVKNQVLARELALPTSSQSIVSTNYFRPGEISNYIVLSLENESDEIYQLIFRDYAKYLLNQNFGETNVPLWLKEGLPAVLQTFRLKNNQIVTFAELQPTQFQLLRSSRLFPWLNFFNLDYSQWQNLNDDEKNLFRVQAFAFVSFLNQNSIDEEHDRISNFLKALLINQKIEDVLKQVLRADLTTFEKEFNRFLAQNSLRQTSLKLVNERAPDAFEWNFNSTAEVQINAVLGDLLVQIERPVEAQKLLERTIASDEKSAAARAALGSALIKQNDFATGLKEIEKALTLEPANFLWHYFYAAALVREETDGTGFTRSFSKEKTAKLRSALTRSIELNPTFSPAYRLSANVNFVNNEDLDGALELIDQAFKLAPGNSEYALQKAHILLRQEKFDDAQKIAERVLKFGDLATIRTKARVLLTSISSIREELKRMLNVSLNQNKSSAPQFEMSPEEAFNQALNEALRKPLRGEKRAALFLTEIDCRADNIVFMARAADSNQILKFAAAEFKKVIFRTFAPGIEGNQIGCGGRPIENFAIITYRELNDLKSRFHGEIVALEFVPPDFKLKQ